MSIEIKIHTGFGNVKFGMTQYQVEKHIGKPSDIYEEVIEGATEVVAEYQDIGVDLSFSSADNFRLGTISFNEVDTLLLDKQFIGITEEKLAALAVEVGIDDLDLEDDFDDLNSKDYYSDQKSLSFWLIDGIVDSITLFPAYEIDDEECPIWPT